MPPRRLAEFDALADEPFVAFLEPPSLDERIINQFALFSLLSGPSTRFDTWLESHPQAWRKIIVPAELKWEVRDKLDQANITERVLYPGLDGLSRWLKRYYTPKTEGRVVGGSRLQAPAAQGFESLQRSTVDGERSTVALRLGFTLASELVPMSHPVPAPGC